MERVVNIHQAKTHLSRLLADVASGKTVVIARSGKPVAKLVPVSPPGKRQFGSMRGLVRVGNEVLDPLPDDEIAAWEGNEPDAASS
jgi:prevent-host-death family protein